MTTAPPRRQPLFSAALAVVQDDGVRLLSALAAAALLLGGCVSGDAPPATPSQAAPASPAAEPTPTAPQKDATPSTGREPCGEAKAIAEQSGSHLVGDAEPPVPYNSTPPTSGWHSSGVPAIGVTPPGRPLTEPQQVSVLEAGGAVISYRGIQPRDLADLRRLARGKFKGRVALTPYSKLGKGQVAVTAWATLLECDGVDLEAVRRFVGKHVPARVEADH